MQGPKTVIKQLLRKHRVLSMQTLQLEMGNKSQRSIFRYLAHEDYFSSFTDAGKYYTLKSTPHFNESGLWFFDAIGFSKYGTLKQTLICLINNSEMGKTHGELKEQLHIRVHNTLLTLVQLAEISRTEIGGTYIYINADIEKADRQLEKRQLFLSPSKRFAILPPDMIQIEILVEIVRASKIKIDSTKIASRLVARGIKTTCFEVEKTISFFSLKKNKI